jgi:hypothetical protein
MSIQFSTLFCICIALVIPLLVLSTSNQDFQEEMAENIKNQLDQFADSNHRSQQSLHSLIHDDDYNNDEHFMLKKAADFEQILKPCNRMPASGRGQEYAECVRSRMLLMGRRKR